MLVTVSPRPAYAVASSPREVCFSVRFNRGGCKVPHGFHREPFGCLAAAGTLELDPRGCQLASVSVDPMGDGRWFVTLADGCRVVSAFSRTSHGCVPSPTPPGSAGVVEFVPMQRSFGSGKPFGIMNVQLTFCAPESLVSASF